MTNSNRLQSKCFKLFITLFIILSSNPSSVNTESNFSLFQHITTCAKNSQGSTIFEFQTNKISTEPKVEDSSIYELETISRDIFHVKLKKAVEEDDTFSFKISIDSNLIKINGTFIKVCESSSTASKCTVIIAFLASLCLILFTALALTLIILRRKKPITFKFGQKEDNDRKDFSDNYDENYENQNKNSSIDVTNNIVTNNLNSIENPRVLQPRKSSLKPSKNLTDQLNNNFSAHENGAFNGTELEVLDEVNEEKIEDKPNLQDARRKSIVTFSATTQVKYA